MTRRNASDALDLALEQLHGQHGAMSCGREGKRRKGNWCTAFAEQFIVLCYGREGKRRLELALEQLIVDRTLNKVT